jgi:hypothetical protein
MPLLDHFRPPLYPRRHWESLHASWSNNIVARLNERILPEGYYAETQIHIGGRAEVDAALEESSGAVPRNGPALALATAPPAPPLVLSTDFPDEIEVQILSTAGGTGEYLVGAIEMISPGNKDRPETRKAFAAKCSSYLQLGIGLIIVDVVTERAANLHDQLMELLGQPHSAHFAADTLLYAAAYRPARREKGDQIDCWPVSLALGQSLPTMPLALRGGPTVPVDLEDPYQDACRQNRLI